MEKLTVQFFSASGTWVAPAGVTNVILIGCGEGGGGGGGSGGGSNTTTLPSDGGDGGGGAIQSVVEVTVVPGISYAVTIGSNSNTGGTAVSAGGTNKTPGGVGEDGQPTTFGSLATFSGGAGAGTADGSPNDGTSFTHPFSLSNQFAPAMGGWAADSNNAGISGMENVFGGFNPGTGSSQGTTNTNLGGKGGSGGAAGPRGAGGSGGKGGSGTASGTGGTGVAGGNAPPNSGAGGGGGGGGGNGSGASLGGASGIGGNGGCGYLYVLWFV